MNRRRDRAFPDLTDRERDVLERLASGATNFAIARELFVSNKTVRNTVSEICAKLTPRGARTRSSRPARPGLASADSAAAVGRAPHVVRTTSRWVARLIAT